MDNPVRGWLALASLMVILPGCIVRRTVRVQPVNSSPPARQASLEELVTRVNAQSEAVKTLSATVDFAPMAGSVYSGVIREYRDVKGFILLQRPSQIRMIGQAPVVRTNIFDMVSQGEEFRLYIPSKKKFIVGKTTSRRPVKNALENLRPQHILEALLVPPIDEAGDKCVLEEAEEEGRRYYVISVVEPGGDGKLKLKRKVWFDRSNLEMARLQFYGSQGTYLEDVHYSQSQDFQGVRFPTVITISRPVEDYRLSITILKAMFNEPIAPEKFELEKPEGAQLVELGGRATP